jgi:hypothetical protein
MNAEFTHYTVKSGETEGLNKKKDSQAPQLRK